MNLDEDEVSRLAELVDSGDAESLAKIFLSLLEVEHAARHKKRPRLVKSYQEAIDEEGGVSNG